VVAYIEFLFIARLLELLLLLLGPLLVHGSIFLLLQGERDRRCAMAKRWREDKK
jgi:hypothetical protein